MTSMVAQFADLAEREIVKRATAGIELGASGITLEYHIRCLRDAKIDPALVVRLLQSELSLDAVTVEEEDDYSVTCVTMLDGGPFRRRMIKPGVSCPDEVLAGVVDDADIRAIVIDTWFARVVDRTYPKDLDYITALVTPQRAQVLRITPDYRVVEYAVADDVSAFETSRRLTAEIMQDMPNIERSN